MPPTPTPLPPTPTPATDADDDGYPASEDCADTDPFVYPGATEICNECDDDCDGEIDEGVTTTYYLDEDDDGYGRSPAGADGETVQACSRPAGYADTAGDCQDDDPTIHPGASESCNDLDDNCDDNVDEGLEIQTYHPDGDQDGYGKTGESVDACRQPEGYLATAGDCNDEDPAINPDETEVCNKADDNCDGQVDEGTTSTFYPDSDGDTYGDPSASTEDCSTPAGYSANDQDCDDTNAAINPAAEEICNGVDDDCDTDIDEGVKTTFYEDADEDTWGNPAVMISACQAPEGYVGNGLDCDDTSPFTYPGTAGCPWHFEADNQTCLTILEAGGAMGDGYYAVDPTGAAPLTVWCDMTTDGGGWTLIAWLGAGTHAYQSINREARFFTTAWLQLETTYQKTSNGGVVLGEQVKGMLDGRDLLELSGELRYSCVDNTQGYYADAIWPYTDDDLNALLTDMDYSATTRPIDVAINSPEYQLYDAYPSSSNLYTWGGWHICGHYQHTTMSYSWQLGICATAPNVDDYYITDVAQVAMGYHDGYTGLRLECTADSPSNSPLIDGWLKAWVR